MLPTVARHRQNIKIIVFVKANIETERKFARENSSQLVKQVRELFKSLFFCSISPDVAGLELRTQDSAVKVLCYLYSN